MEFALKLHFQIQRKLYDLFKKYASKGKDFIYYSFSSKLSSTYQTSCLITQELKEEYPNVKMEVIDTKAWVLCIRINCFTRC